MQQDHETVAKGLDVAYVAHLARLQLSQAEIDLFQPQMEHIVGYVEKISALNVDGIEPMAHTMDAANLWRPDEPRAGLQQDDVLANAPHTAQDLFVVPKIVE